MEITIEDLMVVSNRVIVKRLVVPSSFTREHGDQVFAVLKKELDEAWRHHMFLLLVSGPWESVIEIDPMYLKEVGMEYFTHPAFLGIYAIASGVFTRALLKIVSLISHIYIKSFDTIDTAIAEAISDSLQLVEDKLASNARKF